MFDRYRPLIEECAAAGCGAKDIAGMLGEGYDHRSLYDYMGRRGIRTSPKKCGECQYRTTVKNISHTGDIWVCQKYRMQISKRGRDAGPVPKGYRRSDTQNLGDQI